LPISGIGASAGDLAAFEAFSSGAPVHTERTLVERIELISGSAVEPGVSAHAVGDLEIGEPFDGNEFMDIVSGCVRDRKIEPPTLVESPIASPSVTPMNSAAPANASERGDAQDYVSPPFLVVAVGASAGGLEAFSTLLRPMPGDAPLAVVLVQHMSRTHESQLPEILASRTALRVVAATDEVRVESGCVYVIPPGTQMTVIDGHLRVRPRPEGYGSLQIDALFKSVAEYYGTKAVGVILSGALRDGSEGFRAIRAAGGVTFAQLPEEAQTESMPREAIATGDVDMILPAKEISEQLLRLATMSRYKADHPTKPGAK
jgi:chemotaxis response regulator CheB